MNKHKKKPLKSKKKKSVLKRSTYVAIPVLVGCSIISVFYFFFVMLFDMFVRVRC